MDDTQGDCTWYGCVVGLYTDANSVDAWAVQARPILRQLDPGCGVGWYLYLADVLGGLLSDEEHADRLAADVRKARAAGYTKIKILGHSNGCRIILLMLARHPDLVIDVVLLVAAAARRDCKVNGLNAAAARGQIGKLVLCISSADEWLGIGEMVGYGDLGKVGPESVDDSLRKVMAEPVWRSCLHSDWVSTFLPATLQRAAAA